VPENVQKKQARDSKLLKERTERRLKEKKERAEKRKIYQANAEKYHKEYESLDRSIIDSKRKAKSEGNIFVEAEDKIALVIRIRGINKLNP